MEDWDADLSSCNSATTPFSAERSSLISLQPCDHPFDSFHSGFLYPSFTSRPMTRRTVRNAPKWLRQFHFLLGRSFLLTGKSFLLTVGLCCLRSLGLVFFTYGLVFFAYGGNSVWSSLLTVPPLQKLGLVFFGYGSPTISKLGFVFFAYGSPTVSKKDEP